MNYKVFVYNIKFDTKESIISLSGSAALEGYANYGYINFYSAKEAPDKTTLTLVFNKDPIIYDTEFEKLISNKLKEDFCLSVKSFDYTYNEVV